MTWKNNSETQKKQIPGKVEETKGKKTNYYKLEHINNIQEIIYYRIQKNNKIYDANDQLKFITREEKEKRLYIHHYSLSQIIHISILIILKVI